MISIQNHHPRLIFQRLPIVAALRTLDRDSNFSAPPGEISILLTTDEEIAAIHRDFLQDPTPTDVITFPGDQEENFGGEIIVSVDTALHYITKKGGDLSDELTLYLVHGFLHLCGWDDTTPALRKKMKEAEKVALALLRSQQKMPSFSLKPVPPNHD